ncbi:MAG: hypothetical protein HYU66_26545, partial [Armatimonadetes bacterium]|nr:hypothetical protein [Armatimonadota bacterium]
VRSVRNHCTAWAGYLEPVEVEQRLGIRLDANYFCCSYLRERNPAPYVNFGGALPLRFCRPNGELLDVFQQITHLTDDVSFSPEAEYSYRLTDDAFAPIRLRLFLDAATRLHTAIGVCIHPSNWVRFSERQGTDLVYGTAGMGMPVWSYDQWLSFWEARDTWRADELTFDGTALRVRVNGECGHPDLRWIFPGLWGGMRLREAEVVAPSRASVTRLVVGERLDLHARAEPGDELGVTYGPA